MTGVSNEGRARGLVIFPGALGDLVLFLPALSALAGWSHAPPALYCKSDFARLVGETGLAAPQPIEGREVAWLFSPDPPPEAAAHFASFAWIHSFTGAGWPAVAAHLAEWKGASARVHPFRPREKIHLALHFLRAVGVEASVVPEFRLRLAAVSTPELNLNTRPLLVVHPGSGAASKRWSRRGFAQVIERWQREGGSAVVVLGPAEEPEAAEWVGRFRTLSSPDPLELAAVCSLAVYLGNDSGATHLAAVAGARGVALFGPTEPELWRPLSRRIHAFRLEPWTSLEEIPPEQAISAVERELGHALESDLP